MFYFAGIRGSVLRGYAKLYQKLGQKLVPGVDTGGDFLPRRKQGNRAVRIHLNIPVFPQALHRHADAGLGKAQLMGDVNRIDNALFLPDHQDTLQVVLSGFVNIHKKSSSLWCVYA